MEVLFPMALYSFSGPLLRSATGGPNNRVNVYGSPVHPPALGLRRKQHAVLLTHILQFTTPNLEMQARG